jgi:uncharacterized phiE125 gp8 family phage protein
MTPRRTEIVTPPATLPIDAATLKAHLRVTDSDSDTYITSLIAVAVDIAERYISRSLITRTIRQWLDFFPGYGTGADYNADGVWDGAFWPFSETVRQLDLVGVPFRTITSVQTYNDADEATTLDPAIYLVDVADLDATSRIILRRGQIWPTPLRVAKSIAITGTVGYGTASDVPASLRHAVLLVAAALWSNRGDSIDKGQDVLDLGNIRATLDPYRVLRLTL